VLAYVSQFLGGVPLKLHGDTLPYSYGSNHSAIVCVGVA
jgi:hypothetical protein